MARKNQNRKRARNFCVFRVIILSLAFFRLLFFLVRNVDELLFPSKHFSGCNVFLFSSSAFDMEKFVRVFFFFWEEELNKMLYIYYLYLPL